MMPMPGMDSGQAMAGIVRVGREHLDEVVSFLVHEQARPERNIPYIGVEPEGITGNPEIPFAKSLPDYIMRWLGSRFIEDTETLEELGIMTDEVRAKKDTEQLGLGIATDTAGPANGNGHANGGNGNGAPKPAASAMTETPPVRPAKMQGLDLGPACEQCGGMMQRTGSCYTCSSCGNNTGCG